MAAEIYPFTGFTSVAPLSRMPPILAILAPRHYHTRMSPLSIDHEQVSARMAALIARWEQEGDRRAVFLGCYALMTQDMMAALQAGEFADPEWVGSLLDHFAGYYFAALDADAMDPPAPSPPWRYAFDAAARPGTMVLQNLFLGINAHINYDLVLATADLLAPEWPDLSPEQREMRRADFTRVNHVIAQTVDKVERGVVERYDPLLKIVDALFEPLEDWVAVRLIGHWRDLVWRDATRLVEMPPGPEREAYRQNIEASSLRWARLIDGDLADL